MGEAGMKIVVACGGTGGHVFPGLTTARTLRKRGHNVTVWLSGRGVEESTLSAWDGPVWRTGAQQLRAKAFFAIVAAVWRCWRKMRRERPQCLLAMGSYASLPPVLAARMCGVPVVLHEANAVAGKATAFLARYAKAVAISFPGSEVSAAARRVVHTGLPVRAELAEARERKRGDGEHFTVFVTGGSQGAHAVNELCCAAFCLLAAEMPQLRVLHQSGAADVPALRERYAAAGVVAEVVPFVKEMGAAYAAADVVVCRAGAVTCAELCLCGVAAILIPLPSAVRDHQRLNAASLVASGGAVMIEQATATAEGLAAELRRLAADSKLLQEMGTALSKVTTAGADERLAALVEECAAMKKGC